MQFPAFARERLDPGFKPLYNCCAFGPRKASKVEKPSSRGVVAQIASRGPYCFYQFSGSCPCALSAHMYVCLLLCVYSALLLPWHCCSFPELGPMTQIDLSASLLLHLDNINERTNRIGDLIRHRVS